MNDSKLSSIVEVKRFLKESHVIEFKKRFRKEAYEWIEEALEKFNYLYLSKKEKGLIKKYIEKVTGYSRPQVTLLTDFGLYLPWSISLRSWSPFSFR